LALLIVLLVLAWGGAQPWAQGPTQDELEQGARLYAENCAVCHGPNGEGRVGATLAKDWPSIRPDLRVKDTIVNGVSGSPMPAWSQQKGGPLTDEEIEALVAYILSWETGGPRVPPPAPTVTPRPPITPAPGVQGDPNRGAVVYDQNCAVCHGPNGEGRVGATLAKVWPSIRPDLRVKGTVENGVPGSPMPAWSQGKGGPLSDQDVNDVVAFIVSWSPPAVAETPTPPASALPGRTGLAIGLLAGFIVLVLVIAIGLTQLSRKR
jgi:mono/diheme cytochrome c family protein